MFWRKTQILKILHYITLFLLPSHQTYFCIFHIKINTSLKFDGYVLIVTSNLYTFLYFVGFFWMIILKNVCLSFRWTFHNLLHHASLSVWAIVFTIIKRKRVLFQWPWAYKKRTEFNVFNKQKKWIYDKLEVIYIIASQGTK